MPASADELLAPWFDRLCADLPGLALLDVHTHLGRNDPDGFKQEPAQLLARLDAAGGAGAITFPMHEPGGYAPANDEVLAAVAAAGGRLAGFCRVDPKLGDAAVTEARRALDAGARGIKLHPRAEGFTLRAPAVRGLAALAQDRGLPILIHAGRGIPALGRDTVALAGEHPNARFILGHAGISDLAWLWHEIPAHPNLLLDTAWWSPADLLAVFAYVPPGQVLWASDSPYGTPVQHSILVLRCALQAGLAPDVVLEVAGGQGRRLLAGEPLADLGPAPGLRPERLVVDPLLDRVAANIVTAFGRLVPLGNQGAEESLALARLACAVGADSPHAKRCAHVLELLDSFDGFLARPEAERLRFAEIGILTTALALLRTPDVGLPDLPGEPTPQREEIPA